MTFRVAKVLNIGLMELSMQDSMKMDKNAVKVSLNGQMGVLTLAKYPRT